MSDSVEDEGQRVTILPDGENQLTFLQHYRVRDGKATHIAGLPGGMASGRASVAIVGKLKDGTYALIQTSMRMFLQASAAFLGRYGIEADGNSPAGHNEKTNNRIIAMMVYKMIKEREGSELTLDVDELNAMMQNVQLDLEVAYSADGKRVTFRTTTSQ